MGPTVRLNSLPFKSQNRDVTPGDGLVSTAQRLEEVNLKRGQKQTVAKNKFTNGFDIMVAKLNVSTSSEESAAKGKIKEVVFEPRQRKRLLDSLNIVTPRDKWQHLNLLEF